jgi:hypothetical protein
MTASHILVRLDVPSMGAPSSVGASEESTPQRQHEAGDEPGSVHFGASAKGRDQLMGASPIRTMVGWHGIWRRCGRATGRIDALRETLPWVGANRRAVTFVKPRQAAKGKLWTDATRPEFGEGSTVWGSSRRMQLDRSPGVRGTARRDRGVA